MFFREVDLPTLASLTGGEMVWVGPPAQRTEKAFIGLTRQPFPGSPFAYIAPEMAVAKVHNVCLKSYNSTPYAPEQQVFTTQRISYRDTDQIFHTQAWERKVEGGVEAELGEPAMHIREPAFRLSVANNNFGHFIWEGVAKCLMLSRIPGNESLKILYSDAIPERFLVWLEAAGVARSRMIQLPRDHAVRVDTLYVATAPFAHDAKNNLVLHEESLHDMRQRVWDRVPATPKRERLFFSRADAAQKRCVNEAEICAMLAPYGFRILTGANSSQQELIGYVRNAESIVAPLGAATAAAAFAPADCAVVEFSPSSQVFGKYNATIGALLLGQPFLRLGGTRVILPDNAAPEPIYWDYAIDPAHVQAILGVLGKPSTP